MSTSTAVVPCETLVMQHLRHPNLNNNGSSKGVSTPSCIGYSSTVWVKGGVVKHEQLGIVRLGNAVASSIVRHAPKDATSHRGSHSGDTG
eukprot:2789082-Amphidinium_carterae.1